MRLALLGSLLAACAPPDRPPGEADDPPCVEVWRRLAPSEPSPWGTSSAQIRAVLGGPHAVGWAAAAETGDGEVQLAWPGGLDRLIFATATRDVDPAPPGWCADGIDQAAALQLRFGALDASARGRLRAIGQLPIVEGAFVGELAGEGLDPLGVALPGDGRGWAVWATLRRDDGGPWRAFGEIRPLLVDRPDHEVGPAVLAFE